MAKWCIKSNLIQLNTRWYKKKRNLKITSGMYRYGTCIT